MRSKALLTDPHSSLPMKAFGISRNYVRRIYMRFLDNRFASENLEQLIERNFRPGWEWICRHGRYYERRERTTEHTHIDEHITSMALPVVREAQEMNASMQECSYVRDILCVRRKHMLSEIAFRVPGPFRGFDPICRIYAYEPEVTRPQRTIISLPNMGLLYPYPQIFSTIAASHGFTCYVILNTREVHHEGGYGILTKADCPLAYSHLIRKYRLAYEIIKQQASVNPMRIGTMGASLGGLISVGLLGIWPEVKYRVIGLAGAPLAEMMLTTKFKRFKKRIKNIFDPCGLGEFARYVHGMRVLNGRSEYADQSKITLIMALRDQTVPFASQDRLRAEIGYPRSYGLPTSHCLAFLYGSRFMMALTLKEMHENL